MRERVKDCRDGSHRYFAVVADRRWKFDLDATDWLVGHAGARCSQEDNAVDAMPVPPRPGLRERRGALGSNLQPAPVSHLCMRTEIGGSPAVFWRGFSLGMSH
jgi:hypothetical protein